MTEITKIVGLISRQNESLVIEGIFKLYLTLILSLLAATLFAFATSVDHDKPARPCNNYDSCLQAVFIILRMLTL